METKLKVYLYRSDRSRLLRELRSAREMYAVERSATGLHELEITIRYVRDCLALLRRRRAGIAK